MDGIGRSLAWLTLLMGAITFAIVLFRYGFDLGAIAAQESVLYLHAAVFMLGIPYALKQDEHVRVDVLYSRLSASGRARVNLIGHGLFLIPTALTLLWLSLPYAAASWRILEGSPEVGGIPAVFLLKSLIPLMCLLLFLQGLAEILRNLQTVRRGAISESGATR